MRLPRERGGCAIAVLGASLLAARSLDAQVSRVADSLLAAGDLTRAESVYYAAARIRPRDPVARWALGHFLVERGASRVGATLLEESLQFGGDPVFVGRELARVYLATGEFAALSALPAASAAQRERAKWLTTHEPRVIATDSAMSVKLAPGEDSTSLGVVAGRVNGVAIVLSLTSQAQGIVVSRAVVRAKDHRPRTFGAGVDTTGDADLLAVADSLSIGGRLTMLNQPLTVATLPPGTQGLIGLAALGRFAPTADSKMGTLTLRADGSVREDVPGDRLSTLDLATGLSVLRSGAWIASPAEVARLLRNRGWTFDAKRGTLIVER
ncbi:MAG TPA: hypothetical protein VGH04_07910 [Gemmatimonadaceae bacterium]